MKLLIAEDDDDRRALLALAGLSPPIQFPVTEADAAEAMTPDVPPRLIAVPDPEPTPPPAPVEPPKKAAERPAEPTGGPFGSNHPAPHAIASEAHSQPPGIKCPAGVDELGERLFDAYCFLFDRYRAEGGIHYRAYARQADLKASTASSRLHRLVEKGLAENPGNNGIFRAVVVTD